MQFKQKMPYKLSHVLPVLAFAGGSFLSSCSKEETPMPKKNIEITFSMDEYDQVYPVSNLNKYVGRKDIDTIFLVPVGSWDRNMSTGISGIRKHTLEPALKLLPNARGKGDFDFYPGEASEVPADSLWYIQNGWTINKRFMEKQR